jgi:VIT1/CCC1 family predicted Fe2+/Mn2+ transporter
VAAETQWVPYSDPPLDDETDTGALRAVRMMPEAPTLQTSTVEAERMARWYPDDAPGRGADQGRRARRTAARAESPLLRAAGLLQGGRADDQPLRGRAAGGRHKVLEHRDVNGGWLRPAVFGAMDGLVTNASLIAGVGGGGGASRAILLTGVAGLIAGAFSMATGEAISISSQNELTEAEVVVEQLQHSRNPRGEERQLAQIFVKRGVDPELASEVARQISADPEEAIKLHVREELGIDPDDLPSPWTAAGASFAAFTVGALIPLLPFLIGFPVFLLALVISGIAAFAGGAAVAKLTGRPVLMGGLRQFAAAAVATGMTFLIGQLVGASIS